MQFYYVFCQEKWFPQTAKQLLPVTKILYFCNQTSEEVFAFMFCILFHISFRFRLNYAQNCHHHLHICNHSFVQEISCATLSDSDCRKATKKCIVILTFRYASSSWTRSRITNTDGSGPVQAGETFANTNTRYRPGLHSKR